MKFLTTNNLIISKASTNIHFHDTEADDTTRTFIINQYVSTFKILLYSNPVSNQMSKIYLTFLDKSSNLDGMYSIAQLNTYSYGIIDSDFNFSIRVSNLVTPSAVPLYYYLVIWNVDKIISNLLIRCKTLSANPPWGFQIFY